MTSPLSFPQVDQASITGCRAQGSGGAVYAGLSASGLVAGEGQELAADASMHIM